MASGYSAVMERLTPSSAARESAQQIAEEMEI
jgi:hypothetical protein